MTNPSEYEPESHIDLSQSNLERFRGMLKENKLLNYAWHLLNAHQREGPMLATCTNNIGFSYIPGRERAVLIDALEIDKQYIVRGIILSRQEGLEFILNAEDTALGNPSMWQDMQVLFSANFFQVDRAHICESWRLKYDNFVNPGTITIGKEPKYKIDYQLDYI